MFKVIEKEGPYRIFNVFDVKMIDSLPHFLIYRCGEFIYLTVKYFEPLEYKNDK